MNRYSRLMLVSIFLLAGPLTSVGAAEKPIDFLRDVRPIFVNRCYRCHSSLEQEGNLRLDSSSAIQAGGDSGALFLAGNSNDSLLIKAVLRSGDIKMPPEGEPLTGAQIDILKKWIDEGAELPKDGETIKHWAFVAPTRPVPPAVERSDWIRNPIDQFIAARHEQLQLNVAPEAPKNILLRRVYLDLIGLPPSANELRDFQEDTSPEAYERAVNRLLESPRHGERWGRHWMDVWRYSDWDGYGAEIRESQPHIWRWRDWIIESLNADKPYNRMIVEMLAGDELASTDQSTLRATGYLVRSWNKFNRNVWLDQAIEHTGKAFLGITLNCARCHDHMYDPIAQPEYYRLRAVFEPYDVRTDRIPGQIETSKDGLVRAFDKDLTTPTYLFVRGDDKHPDKKQAMLPAIPKIFGGTELKSEPVALPLAAYYPGAQAFVQEETLAAAKADVLKAETALAAAQQAQVSAKKKRDELRTTKLSGEPATKPQPPAKKVAEPVRVESEVVAPAVTNTAKANVAKANDTATPQQILFDDFSRPNPQFWKQGAGKWEYRSGGVLQSDSASERRELTTVRALPADFTAKFRFKTTGGKRYRSVGLGFDLVEAGSSNNVYLSAVAGGSKLQISVEQKGKFLYPPQGAKAMRVELNREYEMQVQTSGQRVVVSLDGEIKLDYQLASPRPSEGKLSLWTYDATAEFLSIHVTAGASVPPPVKTEPVAKALSQAAPKAAENSSAEAIEAAWQQSELALEIAEKSLIAARAAVASVEARIAADRAAIGEQPTATKKELALAAGMAERIYSLAQAELNLLQGQQKRDNAQRQLQPDDAKSKKALADAEAAFAKANKARDDAQANLEKPNENYTRFSGVHPATSSGRRLGLANWIASDNNPLTARVAVNHLWLRHFGAPLVPTVFDFGANGKAPSHPELLDWLARELIESGWSMKHLHRLMVTSATYRMSSQWTDTKAKSVDPDNLSLWRMNARRMEAELVRDSTLHAAGELVNTMYGPEQDPQKGLTLPRRSVYFRSSKEKKMMFLSLFDSANVVECYRRSESVAPQQALAMANSPLTLAQSRVLAKSLSQSTGANLDANDAFIAAAFEHILGRAATADELAECQKFLVAQANLLGDMKNLTTFTSTADSAVKPATEPRQRARENLIHVLLNHNDFVTVR